ncbi:hypothetical protein N7449_007772 [Penicillium cf. viridicatum]|uniref:Uncharacterized protein n=1 Tax=Penicillium cf. viridicatum TaxID=2972119 RepID=A0A9W9JHV8_9EURO|nr:hypothetical protein N7449_007772 [Penicillium cf. viridicatum]
MHKNRLSWWFSSRDDDRLCPPSPKPREQQKPKDKDDLEALLKISRLRDEARIRGEKEHERFLKTPAAKAQDSANAREGTSGQEIEQRDETDLPHGERGSNDMDPEALELVSTTGRDLDKGKGRARDAPPGDEDMSDNSSLKEESESDGAKSEDVSTGDNEANKEFSESDIDQSLGITSGSLEFPSNWPSHSSASPNSDRQENVEMESMTGNRQEVPLASRTEIIHPRPLSLQNPVEPLDNVGVPLRPTQPEKDIELSGSVASPGQRIRLKLHQKSKARKSFFGSTIEAGRAAIEDVPRPREEVPTEKDGAQRNPPGKNPTEACDDDHGVRASPAPVHRSKYLPDPDLASKIQARIYKLDFYDLHFRHNQSQGPNSHYYIYTEKQLLEEEVRRSEGNLEGYGVSRIFPTPPAQREAEAASLAAKMTTLALLRHQEYIEAGSGAYNELALRAGSSDGFWGMDGAKEGAQ